MENTLSYRAFHHPDQPVILFIHGGGVSSWMWQPVIDNLTQYRCVAVDLPEHGLSAGVGPFSMQLAAESCARVLREVVPGGKATVVGLSEGAQVAVQMLADTPELIEQAFISSALLLPMPGSRMYSNQRLLGWMYDISIPPFRNSDWWIRLNMKYAAGIPEQYYDAFKAEFQRITRSQFVNLMAANQSFRLPPGLEDVQVRTLIVCGQHEYRPMQESARLLERTFPRAAAYQLNLGQGRNLAAEHNWALTAPDVFTLAVEYLMGDRPLPAQLSDL